MKKLIFFFIISFCMKDVPAQSREYISLTRKADSLYNINQYSKAAKEYSRAFNLEKIGLVKDRYIAAKSWAKAGIPDSAFANLTKIVNLGRKKDLDKYMDEKYVSEDTDFLSLHQFQAWKDLLINIKRNNQFRISKLNLRLKSELDSVFDRDTKYRTELNEIGKEKGWNSEGVKKLWILIHAADSLNQSKVCSILDNFGWVGEDIVGEKGNRALFLVIQHSDIKIQERYLPMLESAVRLGNAQPSQLALLTDRISILKGKEQTYGTQIRQDPATLKYYVLPIKDPAKVDERRATVGLGTLATYVAQWGIKLNSKNEQDLSDTHGARP